MTGLTGLTGAYTRSDRPLLDEYRHEGTTARLTALNEAADASGLTPNQVVLAWLLGGPVPVLPILGVSSLAQLEELLSAAGVDLDPEVRARLDAA